jgi:hypothetical protein
LDIFFKVCDLAEDFNMTMIDIARFLKAVPKIITSINKPFDKQI